MDFFSAIELPHWLMIAGALLLVVGFIGLALRELESAQHQHAAPTHKEPDKPAEIDGNALKAKGE